MGMKEIVEQIFEHDKQIAALKDQLRDCSEKEQAELFGELFRGELAETGEVDQLSLKFVRVVELMGDVDAPGLVRLLSVGLDHINADVRLLCAESLFHVAQDDAEQLGPAVDQALETGGKAAEEMLFLLAELGDSQATRTVERFLSHDDAEVVALAIEALVELGDPDSAEALAKLENDKRPVPDVGDDDGTRAEFELGLLAQEAMDILSSEEE